MSAGAIRNAKKKASREHAGSVSLGFHSALAMWGPLVSLYVAIIVSVTITPGEVRAREGTLCESNVSGSGHAPGTICTNNLLIDKLINLSLVYFVGSTTHAYSAYIHILENVLIAVCKITEKHCKSQPNDINLIVAS